MVGSRPLGLRRTDFSASLTKQLNLFCTILLLRGRDFGHAYNELKDIRALIMPGLPMVALTATANCKTRNYIISKLVIEHCVVIKSFSNRPNIFYEVRLLPNCNEDDEAFQFCFGFVIDQQLIFKDKADKVVIYIVHQPMTVLQFMSSLKTLWETIFTTIQICC